jgi:uncharacterized membrane protein
MNAAGLPAAAPLDGVIASSGALAGAGMERVVQGFEVVGVAVIVVGVLVAAITFIAALVRHPTISWATSQSYRVLRRDLGRALLLGLEFLVVADIINSVTIESTLTGVATLGLLVLVRTFLSWSLEVEINGTWPWQRAGSEGSSPSPSTLSEP